eukprot:TRINITY_DN2396_c0_g2_i1.p1 TRINITY_DN2396_c0_g2~~TRINITY_DN2396_c0_g2_i1.p1  ORF type:complete len:231 (+),score=56.60 TRINITY_DN2396_c0_g2_i1:3-695(+)
MIYFIRTEAVVSTQSTGTSEMAEQTYKLTYFDGRGLAETSRYLLSIGGVKWEDNRLPIQMGPPVTRPEFDALKASGVLPYGQVPILEIEGKVIAQSKAIERFLARRFNLYGTTDLEAALIDRFSEGVNDLGIEMRKAMYWAKQEDKDALLKEFISTTVPKHFGLLNNNTVDGSLTLGDVQFAALHESLLSKNTITQDTLNSYPRLKSRYDLFHSNEAISKYLTSRKPTPF